EEAKRFCESMRNQQVGKLLSHPFLMTMSGQSATFMIGGQQACLSGMTMAERADGSFGPAFATETKPFGYQMTVVPVVSGDRLYVECECALAAEGKQYTVTVETPGEEPRTETFRRPTTEMRKTRCAASLRYGQTFLIHGGRDADGRDMLV